MRIVLKNSTLVFAAAKWSATGKVIKVTEDISKVSLPANAAVYSRNLVDKSKAVKNKILNDSGAEVADPSSYFNQFIPAVGGSTLSCNYTITRLYLYDKDKQLIKRIAFDSRKTVTVPAEYNGTAVAWVMIQTQAGLSKDQLDTLIVVMDESSEPTTYEAYQSNTDGTIYSPYSWVWADDLSEIEIISK